MGALKSIIQSVDSTPSTTKDIKETLHLLYDLSESKASGFETMISDSLRTAGTRENPTFPITLVNGTHKEIRVTTSTTPNQDITKGIGDALSNILTGSKENIIGGLTSIINAGLTVLLGAGAGEERMDHTYYIATDGLAIVRLDLVFWVRCITAESITKYAEKSIVCTACKSSVDLSKVDFNSFLSAYQAQLGRCNFKQDELKNEIKNAKEIYELLVPAKNALRAANLFQVSDDPGKSLLNQTVKTDVAWPK